MIAYILFCHDPKLRSNIDGLRIGKIREKLLDKTTVNKLLAQQLDYEFVDTNELIVERSGQTVAKIFREKR